MGIVNGLLNGKGVNRLGSEFGATLGSGKSAFVAHTNGKVYCIFSRNYGNDVVERRLYVAISSDGGNTYAAPLQLTAGYWDDEPTAIQLDLTSTSSTIGIVYVSEPAPTSSTGLDTLRRIAINTSGTVLTPLDPIGNGGTLTHQQGRLPQLINTPSGFIIVFTPNSSTINTLSYLLNTALFTDNAWNDIGQFGPQYFFQQGITGYFTSLHIFSMPNTNLCALGTVITDLDFSGTPTQLPIYGNMVLNVYAQFSADFGSTWSAAQELTSYAGTPQLDLIGLLSPMQVCGTCLADNTVVVSYLEGYPPQFVNGDTPSLAGDGSMGILTRVKYLATKNMLLVAASGALSGNGGVYVYDLTARTSTRLDTSSTPALWNNQINDIAVSSDETYFVAVSDGSVDIVFMGATTTISSWTVTGLRTTSTPATRVNGGSHVAFEPTGYIFSAVYKSSTIGYVGFFVDASSPAGGSFTEYYLGSSGLNSNGTFISRTNNIVVANSTTIYSLSKTTGLLNYSLGLAAGYTMSADIHYDDINNEILVAANHTSPTDNGIIKITDNGSAFTNAGYWATTPASAISTNPSVITLPINGTSSNFKGIGRMFGYADVFSSLQVRDFYSYTDRALYGPINHPNISDQNEPLMSGSLGGALGTASWYYEATTINGVCFIPMLNRGRIRYAYFPYNASTHQVVPSGVNYYDAVNQLQVDASTFTTWRNFSCICDANNLLYYYMARGDLNRTTLQYYAYNGIVEPLAFQLQMRATILSLTTRNLLMRCRIQATSTPQLQMKASIVHVACIMMRAHIAPIVTQTIMMRARILGQKSVNFPGNFYVDANQNVAFRGSFIAQTGYNTNQSIAMQARIAQDSVTSFMGSFLVAGVQATHTFKMSQTTVQTLQILRMRAFIQR